MLEDLVYLLKLQWRKVVGAVLYYYLSFGVAAVVFLVSIYLTLPILRDAGMPGGSNIPYNISIGGQLFIGLFPCIGLCRYLAQAWQALGLR